VQFSERRGEFSLGENSLKLKKSTVIGVLVGLFVVLLSISLIVCSTSDNQAKAVFKGAITEIYDQTAVVSVVEGNTSISSGTNVSVNLSVNKDTLFKIGDKVMVGYDGYVMESSPAQINTEYVKLLEDK